MFGGLEVHRWTTAVNVKLLLPPRQSRGTSLGGLDAGDQMSTLAPAMLCASGRNNLLDVERLAETGVKLPGTNL